MPDPLDYKRTLQQQYGNFGFQPPGVPNSVTGPFYGQVGQGAGTGKTRTAPIPNIQLSVPASAQSADFIRNIFGVAGANTAPESNGMFGNGAGIDPSVGLPGQEPRFETPPPVKPPLTPTPGSGPPDYQFWNSAGMAPNGWRHPGAGAADDPNSLGAILGNMTQAPATASGVGSNIDILKRGY